MGRLAQRVEVETMDVDTGALLLLRRAGLIAQDASLETASSPDVALARDITRDLGGLPLALDQAGAYIEEIPCSLAEYQMLYRTHKTQLFKKHRGLVSDHPEPMTTTWSLSFQKVEQQCAAAADLLRFFAYLAPDAIPEEMIQAGAAHLGPLVQPLGEDLLAFHKAIAVLGKYSLVRREPSDKTVSVHRLVQEVMQEALTEKERHYWMERAVLVVDAAFPDGEYGTWPLCEFLLPHALACSKWVLLLRQKKLEGARLLSGTGHYLCKRAQYEEAESLLKQALSIHQEQLGASHPLTAQSLHNLALLYLVQGRYKEAEPLYRRALPIYEDLLGASHPQTAAIVCDLAELYRGQGRYEEAEPLHRQALSIRQEQLGASHPLTAQSLHNLALLYLVQGRYEEAEPLLKRGSLIAEKQLGASHPDTASSLGSLAALYRVQGRYEEAEPLYQRTLSIRQEQLGVSHPHTASCLNNLALLYCSQGKYTEAEPLYRRALAICEQQLSIEHPQIQQIAHNYLILLAELHTNGDTDALLRWLAQGASDDDKDEGIIEEGLS